MIEVVPVPGSVIGILREAYRTAMRAQIVHDSWHARGWMQCFVLGDREAVLGYVALGQAPGQPPDTLKEFYLEPSADSRSEALLGVALRATGARRIEAQTNDPFLGPQLARVATDLEPIAHLFADGGATALPAPGVRLRRIDPAERANVFPHSTEPIGEWGLEAEARIVATGGFLLHYNPPFADLFMEVAPDARGRGYASYLVQELRRLCGEHGRVPAARCDPGNRASQRALERGGMVQCGRIMRGRVVG